MYLKQATDRTPPEGEEELRKRRFTKRIYKDVRATAFFSFDLQFIYMSS